MPITYTVKPGDGIDKISFEHGLAPDTIWLAPENTDLRTRRHDDRNALLPGDLVVIPDLVRGSHDCATGKRHVFRRRGVPARLHLRFCVNSKPRRRVSYCVTVDGVEHRGRTDHDGCLVVFVPPSATEAIVVVGGDPPLRMEIGQLEPADTGRGMDQRLRNLGYLHDGTLDESLARFQRDVGLAVSGTPDAVTVAALREAHDSLSPARSTEHDR